MATRETGGGQSKASRQREDEDEGYASAEETADVRERHEKLTDDVEELLEDIDAVLEENAEEFVRQYVQKGGQ